MNNYIIMTDSCVDLPIDIVNDLEIAVIPLVVNINGKEYHNYLDEREISCKTFYSMLRDNTVPTTTQLNPENFIGFMEKYLNEGLDILYIGFSSALSGTYNSSIIAKRELEEKYPMRKIVTIDSLSASMGQGLLVTYAAQMRKEGKSMEIVASWVENNKRNLCHVFTVLDLNYLKRSGRLSNAKAFLGTILKIKPLLHVNIDGKLVQTGATRGRKAALKRLVERMSETIQNSEQQLIYISHGDCVEDTEMLKELVLNTMSVKDIIVNYIGPVIGAHSGPGTIAIFYLGSDRFEPYN